MRIAIVVAWTALAMLLAVTPGHAEKRVALVIGNDRYPNLPRDRQLSKAANDAEAVGDALTRLGFQVIRGTNLGRQQMIDKLSELTVGLAPGDTAAFFYAGHGVAIGGVNYLVPSDVPPVTPDGELRVRGASIAEGDVVAELQNRGVRVALLILDACRDNPFPRSPTRAIGDTRGLTNAKPARGIFTIYSAGIGQTALDRLEPNDSSRNSVFTRIFVEQLTSPGNDLGSLAIEVRERVAELALEAKDGTGRPEPHEQTPAYYDQTVGGRVYLAGLPNPPALGEPKLAPLADPAAQAWAAIKDSASVTALQDFVRRYDGTAYADLARARLEEIRTKVATPTPPAAVVPKVSPPPSKPVQIRRAQAPASPSPIRRATPVARSSSKPLPFMVDRHGHAIE
jgi:Caspase domain